MTQYYIINTTDAMTLPSKEIMVSSSKRTIYAFIGTGRLGKIEIDNKNPKLIITSNRWFTFCRERYLKM